MGAEIMLVGDIGGTHARFATVDVSSNTPWRLEHRQDFEIEFPTFDEALRRYMERSGLASVPPAATVTAPLSSKVASTLPPVNRALPSVRAR